MAMLARFGPWLADAPPTFLMPAVALAVDQREPKASAPPLPAPAAEDVEVEGFAVAVEVVVEVRGFLDVIVELEEVDCGC